MAIWTHRVSTSFLQIADTCRSCVCGHVFDADVKQIAGKRFSGTHLLKLDIALICLVRNIHRARQQEVSATPGVEGVLYFGFGSFEYWASNVLVLHFITRVVSHRVLKWARFLFLFFAYFWGARLPVFMLIGWRVANNHIPRSWAKYGEERNVGEWSVLACLLDSMDCLLERSYHVQTHSTHGTREKEGLLAIYLQIKRLACLFQQSAIITILLFGSGLTWLNGLFVRTLISRTNAYAGCGRRTQVYWASLAWVGPFSLQVELKVVLKWTMKWTA